nr:putative ribonuclease H-like domain-containing protein [Tanacetum cinerariifolium]
MNEFCTKKRIRKEFSNARTPQQNGVAERRNKTLIEAARTMLADAKLPVTFWAEAVNTACYVQNRVLKGAGPNWLFDIDTLTNSMNYVPVVVVRTSSTNISAHMETKNSDGCNADDPESSGISNPTATLKIPSAEQAEPAVSLTVETKIPTVRLHVPIVCLDVSPDSSSDPRIISKGDFSQQETLSLGNALTLSNRFEDTFGEEADLSNMETSILEEPKKIFDALKDPSWVEAMQEELLQFKIQNVWILVDCPKGPPGFQDLEFPDRVYKAEKAMYGLHQAPKA